MMLLSNEQRVRQSIESTVEQGGVQLLQAMSRRIRKAERILDPALQSSGTILALQMANEGANPTIFALQSGAMMIAQRETITELSSNKVSVLDLRVANTSATSDRQSVWLEFTVSRNMPFTQTGVIFSRTFEALISLFPDDALDGGSCGCNAPSCIGETYSWEICETDTCQSASATLPCG